jgi:hypothetical protein
VLGPEIMRIGATLPVAPAANSLIVLRCKVKDVNVECGVERDADRFDKPSVGAADLRPRGDCSRCKEIDRRSRFIGSHERNLKRGPSVTSRYGSSSYDENGIGSDGGRPASSGSRSRASQATSRQAPSFQPIRR